METNENWNNEDINSGGLWNDSEDANFDSLENDRSEYNSGEESNLNEDESLDSDYNAGSEAEGDGGGDWDTTETFEDEEDL